MLKSVYNTMDITYEYLGRGAHSKVFRVWLSKERSIILKISKWKTGLQAEYVILKTLSQRSIRGIPMCLKQWSNKTFGFLAFFDTGSTSLRDLLYSHKLLNIRDIFRQVFNVLYETVKKCKVYHCDIKSGNIVIDKDMKCTVIDWSDVHLVNKRVRTFKSTLPYSSPEAIAFYRGERKSYNAELLMSWSLGVLLYEMYFLHLPFENFDESDFVAAGIGCPEAIMRLEKYTMSLLYDAPGDIASLIWDCLNPNCKYRCRLRTIKEYIEISRF
ncbi:serine/threonine-protein kinase SKS1-like [Ixodes scapularis]